MPLKLTITSYQRLSPNQESRKILDRGSLTIGRAASNDWVLQDPERILSKLHCIISYREDDYFLTDRSQNGVFANDSEQRIPKDQPIQINDGDRFLMGDYEIVAEIEAESGMADLVGASDSGPTTDLLPLDAGHLESPAPVAGSVGQWAADPLASSLGHAGPEDSLLNRLEQRSNPRLQQPTKPLANEPATIRANEASLPEGIHFNPPSLISNSITTAAEPAADQSPPTTSPAAIPAESPAVPVTAASQMVIPEDWWSQPEASPPADRPAPPPSTAPLSPEAPRATPSVASTPVPTPPLSVPSAPPPAPRQSPVPPAAATPLAHPTALDGSALLLAFCEGAGLPPLQLSDAQLHRMMADLGGILRETVHGLIEVLLARGDVKGEFQLDRTHMGPVDNNPLKTPPGRPPLSVEEVMTLLLVNQEEAYLPAVRAVHEGFDDIKIHQLAVVAGIQTALARLLERFDPNNLEARLEQSMLDNLWPANRKAKYWDLFIAEYQAIAREAEDDFKKLFGDEFSRAYQNHLRGQ